MLKVLVYITLAVYYLFPANNDTLLYKLFMSLCDKYKLHNPDTTGERILREDIRSAMLIALPRTCKQEVYHRTQRHILIKELIRLLKDL